MAPAPVIIADDVEIQYFRCALAARRRELESPLYAGVRETQSWKDEMAFIEDMLIISQP